MIPFPLRVLLRAMRQVPLPGSVGTDQAVPAAGAFVDDAGITQEDHIEATGHAGHATTCNPATAGS